MPPKRKAKQSKRSRSSEDSASSLATSNKKRKHEHAADNKSDPKLAPEQDVEKDSTNHSVLGGLSGGYRITGDEPTIDPTTTVFKVPFNDKYIICEHRETQNQDDDDDAKEENTTLSSPSLIFTHGAGGGISNPATASFVEGFSHVDPVICFQGTMNLQSRVKTFHAVLQHQRKQQDNKDKPKPKPKSESKSKPKSNPMKIALGGRSMGARAAVMTANALNSDPQNPIQIPALILASYPLVGGKNKTDVRDAILKQIPSTTDVLFVIGSNDSMCDIAQLREVGSQMEASTWLVVVEGADHGMSIRNKGGVEALRLETGAIAAEWLRGRDRGKRYCCVSWNDETGEITGGDWVDDDDD